MGDEVLSAMDMVAAILSAALERRRAEDRLRASEARYRFLTEHSPTSSPFTTRRGASSTRARRPSRC